MNRQLIRRLEHLAQQLPSGCLACRDWPQVWLLNQGDPDPPDQCEQCGRARSELVQVYLIGVDEADI